LFENTRLGYVEMTNTLAYYGEELITVAKHFIVQTPGLIVLRFVVKLIAIKLGCWCYVGSDTLKYKTI